MRVYSNDFGKHGLYVAQILLTMSDLTDRRRFLNVRNTLSTLMEWGVIAIINEHATVAIDEIKFGDNDTLAALVAAKISADWLFILTDVDGLYKGLPGKSGKVRASVVVWSRGPDGKDDFLSGGRYLGGDDRLSWDHKKSLP